ncbi:NADPH:quinone reductase [Tistlia consotensis]|uniref:NADPH:quinone reductase n=1 Tax=Tistlia consotensis USBA 355 TaxID=560819 RepID=A0A1Y6CBN8_9PROT|nr:SRPBCC family protein [Tistlia consotensis]SMF54934.1 NADPH:quinone reductase [Tistlia consotensis USBA 355]SNR87421.1 NADPH:quinone reductase [Tistlia consotensis]
MPRVVKSTVLDAPVEAVWSVIRDFNGHEDWHPAVARSVIEGGRRGDQVGCVRLFALADGSGEIREQLLALDDREHAFSYCLLEAPIPLEGYVAHVRLKPVTDGRRTFWEWRSEFDCPPARAGELTALVGEGIYEAGFRAVAERLGLRRPGRAVRPAPAPAPRRAPAEARAEPPAGTAGTTEAVVLERYGGPEALAWREVPVPPPGRGQVRLRHGAIGLNYIDVYCRTGYFGLVEPPGILGMEAAGVVTEVGPGVHGLMPGDRVGYACAPPGAYARLRTMDAGLLVPLPDWLDDATAAAVLLKGMTAEFLLHRVHTVKEGDTVLVHAAAGGVGTLLCQWARHLGATVIGTVGSDEKARIARANGCTFPIVYSRQDFVEAVLDITRGRGCDVVYDAVGGDNLARSFEALAIRGHLVSYGQASGPIPPQDVAGYAAKSARLSRPNFGHYTSDPAELRGLAGRLFEALERGILKLEPPRAFPLRAAAEAHRALEARETTGSTILLP